MEIQNDSINSISNDEMLKEVFRQLSYLKFNEKKFNFKSDKECQLKIQKEIIKKDTKSPEGVMFFMIDKRRKKIEKCNYSLFFYVDLKMDSIRIVVNSLCSNECFTKLRMITTLENLREYLKEERLHRVKIKEVKYFTFSYCSEFANKEIRKTYCQNDDCPMQFI